MTNDTQCLDDLLSLPDVLGAFLCHSSGRVLMSRVPNHFAKGHVEKSAIDLSQQQNRTPALIGTLQRYDFEYYEFRFYVYSFAKGALFVLCRPKIETSLLDKKVTQGQNVFEVLLKKGTAGGGATRSVAKKQKGERNHFFLPVAACLILLLIAGGVFLYLHTTPSGPPDIAVAPSASVQGEQPAPVSAPVVATTTPAEVLLRLEGSLTLGRQLTPQIAMAFMKDEMFAGEVKIVHGKQPEIQHVVGTLGDGRQVAIEIRSSSSGQAFSCLESGRCDIGMSSRPVNVQELQRHQGIGPLNNSASEHILALDGIAVVLHPVNRIDNLSLAQIADIFTGKLTSWAQLPDSGLDGAIHVYGRNVDAGSSAVFRFLAMHDEAFTSGMTVVQSDAILADEVAADKNAIGFVSLPYMKNAKAIAIEQDGAAPVFPTPFTISTEDYPLSRRLYYYTAVNPKNYLARPFFQFALGDGGQQVAQDRGFVSLTIDKISPPIPSYAPQKYRDSINSADRLSLNFRFKSGSSELDNRGKRDLERLIAFLIKPENRGKSIRLLGFADTRGERAANCYLSKIRAEKVATILQWRGITTEAIEGFCDDMPVATNATALGRERNRRVEVWLGT